MTSSIHCSLVCTLAQRKLVNSDSEIVTFQKIKSNKISFKYSYFNYLSKLSGVERMLEPHPLGVVILRLSLIGTGEVNRRGMVLEGVVSLDPLLLTMLEVSSDRIASGS